MRVDTSAIERVSVRNAPAGHRYEVLLGEAVAGSVVYRARPGLIALVHTEVEARFEGRGLASALIRGALDDARAQGLAVLPFCPYANAWIRRHAEYADLVPEARRGDFGL